jgi:hypothetical protein
MKISIYATVNFWPKGNAISDKELYKHFFDFTNTGELKKHVDEDGLLAPLNGFMSLEYNGAILFQKLFSSLENVWEAHKNALEQYLIEGSAIVEDPEMPGATAYTLESHLANEQLIMVSEPASKQTLAMSKAEFFAVMTEALAAFIEAQIAIATDEDLRDMLQEQLDDVKALSI